MDGAGELQTCLRASPRTLGPGLVTVLLFQPTAIWNNQPLPPHGTLPDQDLHPLSLGLYTWTSSATVSPEYHPVAIAGPLVAVLPLIAAPSGLTAGSVK